jgi:hypothetical protein
MVERQHVRVDWTGASDLGSGVDGFSYSWTQGPTGPVDTTKDVEETVGTATSPPLADGEWWFHLRTVDNAGNWSDLVQLGPFRIDTAAPSTGPPSSSTHMIGEWSTNATVAAAWTATDARSGVDGYFWEGSSSATTAPRRDQRCRGTTTATSRTLADGDWWLHLRARDNAGNWSATAHVGPFRIDASAPANPSPSSTHPADWTMDVSSARAARIGGWRLRA